MVIVGVPISETDNLSLLNLFKDQHVTHVHRFNTFIDGSQSPSTLVVLTFTKQIPHRVTMGYIGVSSLELTSPSPWNLVIVTTSAIQPPDQNFPPDALYVLVVIQLLQTVKARSNALIAFK